MHGPSESQSRELTDQIQQLLSLEAALEEDARALDSRHSGLKDIDGILALVRAKLRVCLAMMQRPLPAGSGFAEREAAIGRRAASAVRLVESLVSENISEDQKGIVQASPAFAEVKKLFEEFLVSGGGGFLEPLEIDQRKKRILSRIVAVSVRRYMGDDDRYPPLDIQRYPQFVQKALLTLFPIFIRLRPQKPPYGIEEGEEITYSSRAMRLPLSQAILYIEDEVLPGLERRLAEEPGDQGLQEEMSRVRKQLEEYRRLKVFPRAAPVLPLEKGYHTQGMTGFTPDGEILVSIPVRVTFKSGTNLDRKMELVRMDVVRRIAGRGVSPEIDREYRRLRSIESGLRGSSRTPSFKLDPAWGSWVLRRDFPFLSRLSDKERFQELVRIVQSGSLRSSEQRIAALVTQDQERDTEKRVAALS
ncbi:MAG TPA: hypothetical protein VL354_10630 [Spirochaetia bacterium]|nr:hypothetical protein [Spirochaetia bacterium]